MPSGNGAVPWTGGKLDNRDGELRWDTPSANNGADKVRDGKSNRGERQGRSKLTEAIVADCKRRYAAGETQAALASEYGVARSAISCAIHGKVRWAHVNPAGS